MVNVTPRALKKGEKTEAQQTFNITVRGLPVNRLWKSLNQHLINV